jgi:hypothetical protein
MLTPLPDAYLIYVIAAAWQVSNLAYEKTGEPQYGEAIFSLEPLWRLEAEIFFLHLHLWLKSQ